jgi:hypothetical protein
MCVNGSVVKKVKELHKVALVLFLSFSFCSFISVSLYFFNLMYLNYVKIIILNTFDLIYEIILTKLQY